MDQLPTELSDEVFQWLYVERDMVALRSCTLVCRNWLPCARRYLFSQLIIPNWPPERNITNLIDLLRNAPTIAQAVAHFALRGFGSFTQILRIGDFFILLGMLKHLQHIFIGSRWAVDSHAPLEAFTYPQVTVQCLEFEQLREVTDTVPWLIRLVSCKELKIWPGIQPRDEAFVSQLVFASPAPSSIDIQDAEPSLQHFIHHLPSDRLYDSLQEFRISF